MSVESGLHRRNTPELEIAYSEGEAAHALGMSRESNPYTDQPGLSYGPQWQWNNGWWQRQCDVDERMNARAS